MEFYHLVSGLMNVNAYFLVNENKQAIVIDCGTDYEQIKEFSNKHGFNIKAVLLTHAHFDHSLIAKQLQDDGAKVYVHEKDAEKLKGEGNLSRYFGIKFIDCDADVLLKDKDEIDVLGLNVRVIHTPGHTDGSVSYLICDMLFTGDTMFYHSYGRTDFPTGSYKDIMQSIKKLAMLKGDYPVYPGHEEFTTLEEERKFYSL